VAFGLWRLRLAARALRALADPTRQEPKAANAEGNGAVGYHAAVMPFRFLHLADLHLETNFGGRPETRR